MFRILLATVFILDSTFGFSKTPKGNLLIRFSTTAFLPPDVEGCVTSIVDKIDYSLEHEVRNIKLPAENLLGFVTLSSGKITKLEKVKWGDFDQRHQGKVDHQDIAGDAIHRH